MTKNELVKGMAKLKGISRKEVEERIVFIDEMINFAKEAEGKTKIGRYFTVQKKHEEAKSGKINGKDWSKEAYDRLIIKATAAAKEL